MSFELFDLVSQGKIKKLEDFLIEHAQHHLNTQATFRTYVNNYNGFKQTGLKQELGEAEILKNWSNRTLSYAEIGLHFSNQVMEEYKFLRIFQTFESAHIEQFKNTTQDPKREGGMLQYFLRYSRLFMGLKRIMLPSYRLALELSRQYNYMLSESEIKQSASEFFKNSNNPVLQNLYHETTKSLNDPNYGLESMVTLYPGEMNFLMACEARDNNPQEQQATIQRITGQGAKLSDFALHGTESKIVGVLGALIKIQNETLENFEELLLPFGFDQKQQMSLKNIKDDQLIHLNQGIEEWLTDYAYCKTDFANEDEFVIDSRFLARILLDKVLRNCVRLIAPENEQADAIQLSPTLNSTAVEILVFQYFLNANYSDLDQERSKNLIDFQGKSDFMLGLNVLQIGRLEKFLMKFTTDLIVHKIYDLSKTIGQICEEYQSLQVNSLKGLFRISGDLERFLHSFEIGQLHCLVEMLIFAKGYINYDRLSELFEKERSDPKTRFQQELSPDQEKNLLQYCKEKINQRRNVYSKVLNYLYRACLDYDQKKEFDYNNMASAKKKQLEESLYSMILATFDEPDEYQDLFETFDQTIKINQIVETIMTVRKHGRVSGLVSLNMANL